MTDEGHDRIDGPTSAELHWRKQAAGVWLSLDLGTGLVVELDLHTKAPARLSLREVRQGEADSPGWHMVRGLGPPGLVRGHRADAFAWLFTLIWDGQSFDAGQPGRHRFRDLAVHAAEACAPVERRAVLRFCPHLRFRLYQRLVEDGTGRLAQMAAACPGALIFAMALIEQGGASRTVGETLLRRVWQGVRLGCLLDEAVAGWADAMPEVIQDRLRRGERSPALHRVADAGPADRARLCQEQRLLIRRAGPRVPTTLLWLPPPLALVPEDIPRAVRANARWFRVMKAYAGLLGEPPPEARPAIEALSRLASRQADALLAAPSTRHRPRTKLAVLRDHLVATGRRPAPDRDPEVLLAQARQWHRELHPRRRISLPAPGPEVTLPTLPGSAWETDDLVVRPLVTAGELQEEGWTMRHCVATYVPLALAGRVYLFAAEVRRRRLTVEVQRVGDRLYLGQVQGKQNRDPSALEIAALRPWLDRLGVG